MKWETIKDYPNYMVSNMGEVKSLGNNKTRKEKILKSRKNNKGYLYVSLCKEGKVKKYLIHRLVAQAFIPNTDNKPQIDHISTDRTDNRVENLRWVSTIENRNNPLTKIKHKRVCTEGTKNKISQSLKEYYARVG